MGPGDVRDLAAVSAGDGEVGDDERQAEAYLVGWRDGFHGRRRVVGDGVSSSYARGVAVGQRRA
jgi:hypothetical protein